MTTDIGNNQYSDEVVLCLADAFSKTLEHIVDNAEILDKFFYESREKRARAGLIVHQRFEEVEEYMNLQDPEKNQLRELRDRVLEPLKPALSERRK